MLIGCGNDCNCNEKSLDWILEQLKWLMENKCQGNEYIYNQTINGVQPIKDGNTVRRAIRSYTYDDLTADINKLITKYPTLRYKCLGNSVLGLKLHCLEYGAENAYKHLFIFNGQHGNECSASITLAGLENLILNTESYYGVDLWNDILAKDTCVHVIPMANPDAWQLGIFGFGYFPNITEEQKSFIETTFTEYMRTQAKDEEIGSAWTLAEKEEVEEYIRSLGGDPSVSWEDYQFREKDLHAWSANANGIDLYFNWFSDEMNANNYIFTVCDSLTGGHHEAWRYGACGTKGMVDENKVYYDWMTNIKENGSDIGFLGSMLCYHQKGPTKIWNYGIKGYQKNRNRDCFVGLCELTHVPYNKTFTDSYVIGCNAWFQRWGDWRGTLACNCEVGFKYDEIAGDGWDNVYLDDTHITRAPVPDSQWPWIYEQERETILYMVRFYSSLRDVWNSHGNLTAFNFSDMYTEEEFAVPSMNYMKKIDDKLGVTYTLVTELGLTPATVTIPQIVEALNHSGSIEFYIQPDVYPNICAALPGWTYSDRGSIKFYQVTEVFTVVEFRPANSGFKYSKVYTSVDYDTNWINETETVCDAHCFGMTVPIVSTTIEQFCELIPENHNLSYYIGQGSTVVGVPSGAGANYQLILEGRRTIVRCQVQSDLAPQLYYMAYYSRNNKTMTKWYKFTATEVGGS